MSDLNSRNLTVGLIRWTARALSLASTAMLLLFLFGEPFQVAKLSGREIIALCFFPLGIIVGFAVAWWKEGVGGAITILSLLIFYAIFVFVYHDSLARGFWFLVFASPGLLFLAAYLLSRSGYPVKSHA